MRKAAIHRKMDESKEGKEPKRESLTATDASEAVIGDTSHRRSLDVLLAGRGVIATAIWMHLGWFVFDCLPCLTVFAC